MSPPALRGGPAEGGVAEALPGPLGSSNPGSCPGAGGVSRGVREFELSVSVPHGLAVFSALSVTGSQGFSLDLYSL